MKNLRIGKKLLVAFGGIALLVAGLAWFSNDQLGQLNALIQLSVDDRLPKLLAADEIDTATSDFRVAEGQHILAATTGDRDVAEGKLTAQRQIIERDYEQLESTLRKPQAIALLQQFHASWTSYLAQDAALLRLSRGDKDAEATALMRGKSQQLFDTLSQNTGDLAAFEAKLMSGSGDEADALHHRAQMLLLVAVGLVVAGLGSVFVVMVKQIAQPVGQVTSALGELARGKMDVVVPVEDRADEVGALADALKLLRDQLAAAERSKAEQTALIVDSIGEALSKLADGDLVARVTTELTGPFAKLKTDFNQAAASLQGTLSQVKEAAGGINSGASDIRQASDDLSQRTEQQAASLEETAAAMDEITGTVRTTAARAGSATAAVGSARSEAEHSGEVVRRAVDAMGAIERSSGEISEIISVIDGIAFQTNLLALNAGVEAARAGDAGKGFAVVAAEVRALAQRSAEAAQDVKTRILVSSKQVEAGVELVGETGSALIRIIERITEIDGLVSDIAASAEQQSTGLQQINTAVSEMDGVTQQNAAMVEQATAAARSLATEVDGMSRQIARFRTGDTPSSSPVHELQDRAAFAARKLVRAPSRARGGAAAAAAVQEDWSSF